MDLAPDTTPTASTTSPANPTPTADILVVDDTPENLRVLAGMLKQKGHRVRPVPSGALALSAAKKARPDVVLLDINMPEMDGYEVCERLRADPGLEGVPVIFISALTETLDKVRAFAAGGNDYVTKPFQFEEVSARVDTHWKVRRLQLELERHNRQLEELVRAQVKEISDSQMATIFAIARLAESRDEDTGRHLERTRSYCRLLAGRLAQRDGGGRPVGPAFVENIYFASPLHDIGKVSVPDAVLRKPARLTPDEFGIMKRHAPVGADTLQAVLGQYPKNAFVAMGIEIARWHHEKWNGTGYPDGLRGEATPLAARIMAVADVYDALRTPRCYKPAMTHEQACDIIVQDSGTHFDPHVVEVFREVHGELADIEAKLTDVRP